MTIARRNIASALPKLFKTKLYKTGQTRGADDDVIFQNRVGRNSTVLIPFEFFERWKEAPDNNGIYEQGFIVLMNPKEHFTTRKMDKMLSSMHLELGVNTLLFYETRKQWNEYNPDKLKLAYATSRTPPLGGVYVARIPSTTAEDDEKILRGFSGGGMKGAGIRVYEYASQETIRQTRIQLELLFWLCHDSRSIALDQTGVSLAEVEARVAFCQAEASENSLDDMARLVTARVIGPDGHTVCPLCQKPLSASGFLNRLGMAEGRDIPDLTVTQLNLFHIEELRIGEFNHRAYNLGWGHHYCNSVTRDLGITATLTWMEEILAANKALGYI